MKKILAILAAAALACCFVLVAGDSGQSKWLDLEGCSVCKQMTAEEGLMQHMQWENHAIGTGMISLTRVDPDYEQAYQRSHQAMQAVLNKLMQGEEMPLCGFCRSMGELAQAGARFENIDAGGNHIMIVSATSPELIEKIHVHAERTIAEFTKMTGEHDHHGHDHGEGHDQDRFHRENEGHGSLN